MKVRLRVVSLCGADLGQLGQDAWLTKCDAVEYTMTRVWARAIRGWTADAAGFVWRSKRDEDRLVYVFFADRLPSQDAVIKVGRSQPVDRGHGLAFVRKVLNRHNVVLGP